MAFYKKLNFWEEYTPLESRNGKENPCDNPSCMRDIEDDNAHALQKM